MISSLPVLGLSILPIIVFIILFRNSWSDFQLCTSACAGFILGIVGIGFVKFLIYPVLAAIIGEEIREFIILSGNPMTKMIACIFLTGCTEELVKFISGILGVLPAGGNYRSTTIVISFIAASLGFSTIENLDYINIFGDGVLWGRIIVSSTGHAIFSGITAVFTAYAMCREGRSIMRTGGALLSGFILASSLHGVFNFVIFEFSAISALPIIGSFFVLAGILLYEGWIKALIWDSPTVHSPVICPLCLGENTRAGRFCAICGARVIV